MKSLFLIYMAVALSFWLPACGSMPRFQKKSDGNGYKIENLEVKNSFKIVVPFASEEAHTVYVQKYAFRAAAEECFSRGFDFFDFSNRDAEFYGFCYPQNFNKGLAITFADSGLDSSPRRFVVENLNNKTYTKLKVGDEVLAVSGQPTKSMWQMKYLVFSANSEKKSEMELKIKRGQEELAFVEPLADFTGHLYGKENLEALRKSVK